MKINAEELGHRLVEAVCLVLFVLLVTGIIR